MSGFDHFERYADGEESMDWYTVFKLLHVLTAIIWIGGVFVMLMLGIHAAKSRDDAQLVQVVQQMGWAAERIYVPASIATVLLGMVVAALGDMWSYLWVIVGLAGMAITMALGILALTPRVKKIAAIHAVTPETIAISRQTLTLVKFDCAALFVVVADMVLKPQIDDWTTMAVMTIVVLGAAVIWLAPGLRRVSPA